MLSPRFDRAKREYPGLDGLLDRLGRYLRNQIATDQTFFVPKLVGAALGINNGEAYVLLEVLTRVGLLRRVFNVYCKKNDLLLATIRSEEQLKDVPHCDECDRGHHITELRLEIAFEPIDEASLLWNVE